jgi:phosphopantothenoylcysteine decarboxylase / phosphopantothenate---cysteine ligase
LLSTLCLATTAPIFVAPAMNVQMWLAKATQQNVVTLLSRDVRFLGPDSGDLACGEIGAGRMLNPDVIVELLEKQLDLGRKGNLVGKKVLLTAGSTQEAIDPVRFLSNRSSGKMGYALAKAARDAGAKVLLVSGEVALPKPDNVTVFPVSSAQEMFDQVLALVHDCDVFVAVAAVADYRVKSPAKEKIKKSGLGSELTLELVENPDIVSGVGALDDPPFILGFAAETNSLERHALEKLKNKKMDLIAANLVNKEGLGFGTENNHLLVFSAEEKWDLGVDSKDGLAQNLIRLVSEKIN